MIDFDMDITCKVTFKVPGKQRTFVISQGDEHGLMYQISLLKQRVLNDRDVSDLASNPSNITELPESLVYDPDFGDDKLCRCDHEYRHHFDPYEDNAYVGCKYCSGVSGTAENWWDGSRGICSGFKLKEEAK